MREDGLVMEDRARTLGWAPSTIRVTSLSRSCTIPWTALLFLAMLSYFSTANSPALCSN